jgi:hypothetical protein
MDPQGYRHAYLKVWRDEVTNYLRLHADTSKELPLNNHVLSLRTQTDEIEF